MNEEFIERLRKAIRDADASCGGERHAQYWSDLVRAVLSEIAAAGMVIVPRELLEQVRDSRAGHDWSEGGYWYADERMDNQIRSLLSAVEGGESK